MASKKYQTKKMLQIFTPKIELGEPKYCTLCKFSVESSIYNAELPEIIKNRLAATNMTPDPSKFYLIDISFSIDTYKHKAFYEFPVKLRPRVLGKPKQQTEQEKVEAHINEVLSHQLKNICREASIFGVKYRYATIAEEEFKDVRRVVFRIYEDVTTTTLVAEQKDRRKRFNPTVYTTLPHRSLITNGLATQVANSFNILRNK